MQQDCTIRRPSWLNPRIPSNALVIGALRECARLHKTFRTASDEKENQPSDISATCLACTP